jgi:hypothetical protein
MDLDCDKQITWQEFAQFLLDYSGGEHLNQDVILRQKGLFTLNEGQESSKNLQDCAQNQIKLQFKKSTSHIERINHNTFVSHLFLHKSKDLIVLLESD